MRDPEAYYSDIKFDPDYGGYQNDDDDWYDDEYYRDSDRSKYDDASFDDQE